MQRPDPFREIRLASLRSLRGASFWSRHPVTRMDLTVGAYEDISSADVPGLADALVAALPGLAEHRCSIGERGGFVARLRRGTYAPHIVEHVALELQALVGHDVGYGRARGGDRPGEYTVIFEHRHAEVGLRAAAVALALVQRGFAGTLDGAAAETAGLAALASLPDPPPPRRRVLCGITGGGDRSAVRAGMARLGAAADRLVDVAPGCLLHAGLPYSRSEAAVILDAAPTDVPARYRAPDRARRLVGVVADAVREGGLAVVPAKEWEIQEMARDAGCRVAVFSGADDVSREDARLACAVGYVRGGRVVLERRGEVWAGHALRAGTPPAAQVAAALAMFALDETPVRTSPADD